MERNDIKQVWQMTWDKHLADVAAFQSKLSVKEGAKEMACVQDYSRNYIASNLNTHRVVYLPQSQNGKIDAGEVLGYLASSEALSIQGRLETADRKPGISLATVHCGDHVYEVVFTDLPFCTQITGQLLCNGGILNTDAVITEDTTFHSNVLCSGVLKIEKGVTLTVAEGATLVAHRIENFGQLNGALTGNILLYDGAVFNGALYTGCIHTEGHATITGFFAGDTLTAADGTTLLLQNAGGMFNAMEFGKGVTFVLADSEPGLCGFEGMEWYMDFDHPIEDVMRQNWFLLGDKTPTDMLGRMWSPLFDKNAILRPDLNGGGVIKMEPDLALRGQEGTHHNYAVLAFGKEKITDVAGTIYAYTTFGLACPAADMENLILSDVTGAGTEADPYTMTVQEKDPQHPYISPMDLSLQALATPVISQRFPKTTWRFLARESDYVWYGYNNFKDCEHWHGENGRETLKIYVKPI